MPETIIDLGRKVKAKYPGQYDDLDDADLGRKVRSKHPEYSDFTDVPAQPSKPADFNDDRSASGVAVDGAVNVLRGIPQAVTGIPSMVGGGASALYDMLTGKGTAKAQEMLSGTVAPLTTSARGLGSLLAPDSIQSPTNTDWQQAQQGAGANAGGLLLGEGLAKVAPKIRSGLDPSNLMLRAAENRMPSKPSPIGVSDVAASGVGLATGGPIGAAIGEGANVLRKAVKQPYRNLKASVQEALAKRIASGAASPEFASKAAPARADIEAAGLPPQEQIGPFAGNMREPAAPPQEIPFTPPPSNPAVFPGEMKPPATPSAEIPMALPERNSTVFPGEMKSAPGMAEEIPFTPTEDFYGQPEIPRPNQQVTAVEQAIAPTPKDRLTIHNIVPDLLKAAPEIGGLRKGPTFDAALLKAFKRVEANVDAADATVAPDVTVPKATVVDGFQSLANEYTEKGLLRTASQIQSEAAKWADLPDSIPWEEFRNRKRTFFRENKSSSAPMRRAYGVLIDASNKFSGSEVLQQANSAYSIVRRAIDAAKIHPGTGRRIMEVGKSPKPTIGSYGSEMLDRAKLAESVREALARKQAGQ